MIKKRNLHLEKKNAENQERIKDFNDKLKEEKTKFYDFQKKKEEEKKNAEEKLTDLNIEKLQLEKDYEQM